MSVSEPALTDALPVSVRSTPMIRTREVDPMMGELYLAGEVVPPGEYRAISGGRYVVLKTAGMLPASLDGHVACYRRVEPLPTNNAVVHDTDHASRART